MPKRYATDTDIAWMVANIWFAASMLRSDSDHLWIFLAMLVLSTLCATLASLRDWLGKRAERKEPRDA